MAEVKRLTVELTPDEHHQLKIMAARKNKTLKDTVLELFDLNELMKEADGILYLANSLLKTPDALDKRDIEVSEFFDKLRDYSEKQVEFCATWRMDGLMNPEELAQVKKYRSEREEVTT